MKARENRAFIAWGNDFGGLARRSLPKVKPPSPGADVAVPHVRRLFRRELVLLLQLSQPVRRIGWHWGCIGRLQVEAVEARGVQTEDRLLGRAIGIAKWSKSVFLLHIFRDLQSPHRFDLPSRGPI